MFSLTLMDENGDGFILSESYANDDNLIHIIRIGAGAGEGGDFDKHKFVQAIRNFYDENF